MAIRVLIADDFELLRGGIQSTLDSHREIEVVGQAEDGLAAVERVKELRPDVLILDLRMGDHGGMEAIHACREQAPEVKILVLTANENPDNMRSAVAAGAAGYLTKQTSGRELCEAVLAVSRGGLVVVPPATGSPEVDDAESGAKRPLNLTARQRAIVRLLSYGFTDHEIAEKLFVSIRTVQYDVSEVKLKAGVTQRSEIARWAVINSLA